MKDGFNRIIDYMRISVTDRCNLRCVYCMSQEGVEAYPEGHLLTHDELLKVVTAAAALGVNKVRITGGEPLARPGLIALVKAIKEKIPGIENLSLTTNGILLEKYASELAAAGLDRVNVSLDSMNAARYAEITRGGDIQRVFKGIEAAERAGLKPVKINMVPVRGLNDDEIEDFARLTLAEPKNIRFIEFMPFGGGTQWSSHKCVSVEEMRRRVEAVAPLEPVKFRKYGPARYYRFSGAPGVIGFISAITHHFCGECNRLRLTSDGKLRPCLYSESEIDLRGPLRNGASDEEIKRLLKLAVEVKPEGHRLTEKAVPPSDKPMSKIGG
jgi:cyclic pyranopterin phosphate synthase